MTFPHLSSVEQIRNLIMARAVVWAYNIRSFPPGAPYPMPEYAIVRPLIPIPPLPKWLVSDPREF